MFSQTLRQLRLDRGFTQIDLAKQVGITQQSIAGWESNKINPDVPTLHRLAKYFNVTTDYLLGNEPAAVQYSPDENRLVRLYRNLNVADQQAALRILTGLQSAPA